MHKSNMLAGFAALTLLVGCAPSTPNGPTAQELAEQIQNLSPGLEPYLDVQSLCSREWLNLPSVNEQQKTLVACMAGASDGINRKSTQIAPYGVTGAYSRGYQLGLKQSSPAELLAQQQAEKKDWEAKQASKKQAEQIAKEKKVKEAAARRAAQPKFIDTPECEGITRQLIEESIPRGVTITIEQYKETAGWVNMACVTGGNDGYYNVKPNGLYTAIKSLHREAYYQGYMVGQKKAGYSQ